VLDMGFAGHELGMVCRGRGLGRVRFGLAVHWLDWSGYILGWARAVDGLCCAVHGLTMCWAWAWAGFGMVLACAADGHVLGGA
jgi:hypothetical protein